MASCSISFVLTNGSSAEQKVDNDPSDVIHPVIRWVNGEGRQIWFCLVV